MNQSGSGLLYLKYKFTKINDAKLKEGIFVGPHVWEIMWERVLGEAVSDAERGA